MSGRNGAKNKGDRAELEIAGIIAEGTGWAVRRKLGAGRADDTGDLYGLPSCTAQVKDYVDVLRAIREGLPELRTQQTNSGDPFAALFVRRRGGKWAVLMEPDQFCALLREATQPDTTEVRDRALGPGHGHEMRDLYEDGHGYSVLCECGDILHGPYSHHANDMWMAHRDEMEDGL